MIIGPFQQALLGLISGSVVGLTLGLIGGGGSILAVPLLVYVVGITDPHIAIGTSAIAVAASASINLANHARHGHVRWGSAVTMAASGVIGAVPGSTLGKSYDGQSLLTLFSLLMMVVAYLSAYRRLPRMSHCSTGICELLTLGAVGVGIGATSGFFGIGGGFLHCPWPDPGDRNACYQCNWLVACSRSRLRGHDRSELCTVRPRGLASCVHLHRGWNS